MDGKQTRQHIHDNFHINTQAYSLELIRLFIHVTQAQKKRVFHQIAEIIRHFPAFVAGYH